jgi:enoyl-CoA hydratase/carnithine racemase
MEGLTVPTELTVVDLADPGLPPVDEWSLPGPVVAVSAGHLPDTDIARAWVEHAGFTLTEQDCDDRRVVRVSSVRETLDLIAERVADHPISATVCDDVLRAGDADTGTAAGLVTESLAYSTLQAGPEFARWLAGQRPRKRHEQEDAVLLSRDGPAIDITFNRPDRHNAFSNALRAGLIDGLTVALSDPSIASMTLRGNGKSFCSGGDLTEFGMFTDPAHSHIARTRYSPALLLAALTTRLGPSCRALVHGAVLGSGLEMAAYCGFVGAHPDTVFGLPELDLGLVPGAGGTVSIPRRIGRWRTGYLVLSGRRINAPTALRWGLIDLIDRS